MSLPLGWAYLIEIGGPNHGQIGSGPVDTNVASNRSRGYRIVATGTFDDTGEMFFLFRYNPPPTAEQVATAALAWLADNEAHYGPGYIERSSTSLPTDALIRITDRYRKGQS